MKGCSYDNAVTEATYKIIKTEFIKPKILSSLVDLQVDFTDYTN